MTLCENDHRILTMSEHVTLSTTLADPINSADHKDRQEVKLIYAFQNVSLAYMLALPLTISQKASLFEDTLDVACHSNVCPDLFAFKGGQLVHMNSMDGTAILNERHLRTGIVVMLPRVDYHNCTVINVNFFFYPY